jgi:hypothetical protein
LVDRLARFLRRPPLASLGPFDWLLDAAKVGPWRFLLADEPIDRAPFQNVFLTPEYDGIDGMPVLLAVALVERMPKLFVVAVFAVSAFAVRRDWNRLV